MNKLVTTVKSPSEDVFRFEILYQQDIDSTSEESNAFEKCEFLVKRKDLVDFGRSLSLEGELLS